MIMVWLARLTFRGPPPAFTPPPPLRLFSIGLKQRCRCLSTTGEIVVASSYVFLVLFTCPNHRLSCHRDFFLFFFLGACFICTSPGNVTLQRNSQLEPCVCHIAENDWISEKAAVKKMWSSICRHQSLFFSRRNKHNCNPVGPSCTVFQLEKMGLHNTRTALLHLRQAEHPARFASWWPRGSLLSQERWPEAPRARSVFGGCASQGRSGGGRNGWERVGGGWGGSGEGGASADGCRPRLGRARCQGLSGAPSLSGSLPRTPSWARQRGAGIHGQCKTGPSAPLPLAPAHASAPTITCSIGTLWKWPAAAWLT